MVTTEKQEVAVLTFVRENWLLLAFFAGLVTTWVNFQNVQESASNKIATLEQHMSSVDTNQSQILVQLAQIQTDLSWIRKQIQK